MTSRLGRFTVVDQVILVGSLILLPMLFPQLAAAQTDTKPLVLEIKNFTIPSVQNISDYFDEDSEEPVAEVVQPLPTPVPTPAPKTVKSKKVAFQYPPRVESDERVYMHEPEIRDYICPKVGQKQCEIFIAVLKAENGTHECTRDNRGINPNGSIDVGLAQINWNANWHPPYTIEQLRDCKFNLDIALKKYQARGFQPWYAYTKGAYKKFLKPVAVN